ncbi:MAG: hypothetical protein M3Q48_00605 [Actinomycetota bacterium]|jgi:hypothetical protein|nr:hypothetical protein [Actinomycetota bacterium]
MAPADLADTGPGACQQGSREMWLFIVVLLFLATLTLFHARKSRRGH